MPVASVLSKGYSSQSVCPRGLLEVREGHAAGNFHRRLTSSDLY